MPLGGAHGAHATGFVTREFHVPDEGQDSQDWQQQHPANSSTTTTANARSSSIASSSSARPADPVGRTSSSHSARSNSSSLPSGNNNSLPTAAGALPPLPALPSSLLDALAREPPPPPPIASNSSALGAPRTSLNLTRGDSGPSPSLPTLPPHSPLGFSYSASPPMAGATATVKKSGSKSSLGSPAASDNEGPTGLRTGRIPRSPSGLSEGQVGARRSPAGATETSNTSSGSGLGGFFSGGGGGGGARDDHSSSNGGGSTTKRSGFLKNFTRQRSSETSPNTSPNPSTSSWSSSRSPPAFATTTSSPITSRSPPSTNPTSSTSNLAPPATASHPVVGRRASSTRMSASADPSKWLFEAQQASSSSSHVAGRKPSIAGSGVGLLGLAQHVEGTPISSAPASELRREAGRGVDAELDAMDDEGDDEDDGGGAYGLGGRTDDEEDEDVPASRWRRGHGEQYTLDLARGAGVYESDVDDEEGDRTGNETEADDDGSISLGGATPSEQEVEQLADETTTLPPSAEGESLFSRRRTLGPLEVDVARASSDSDERRGPQTAPLPLPTASTSPITPRAFPTVTSYPQQQDDSFRSRSRSDGDVAFSRSQYTTTSGAATLPLSDSLRNLSLEAEAGPSSPTAQSATAAASSRRASEPYPKTTRPQDLSVSTADFVVAVVGPRNVGKSTVIRRGLKRPTGKPMVVAEDDQDNRVTTCTSYFTISGQSRSIQVLEIDMALLRYDAEGVIWPEGLPQCEGAMLCYDSTDPRALDSLSLLLQAFWTRGSDVPLMVLACKAQTEASLNATDPNKAAAVCNVYGAGIVSLDGGVQDSGRKMKESFNWMIRTIMDNRGEVRRPASSASISPSTSRRSSAIHDPLSAAAPITSSTSRPAATATNASGAPIFDNPFGEIALPSTTTSSASSTSSLVANTPPVGKPRGSRGDSLGLGLSIVQEAPVGAGEDEQEELMFLPAQRGQGPELGQSGRQSLSGGVGKPELESVQEVHSPQPQTAAPPARPVSPVVGKRTSTSGEPPVVAVPGRSNKTSALDLHFSREDMIDKFLFASVTGNDEQYVTLFLIVYRRFARPYDVLSKLIERFEFVHGRLKTDPLLSRFAQMKLCGVLSTWFQTYPGDFTAASTFGILQPFLNNILPRGATWVAHYAIELIPLLPALQTMVDPEASWALPDKPLEGIVLPPEVRHPRRPSVAPSIDSATSSLASGAQGQHGVASSINTTAHDSVDGNISRLSVPTSTAASSPVEATFTTSSASSGQQQVDASRRRSGSDAGTLDTMDSATGANEQTKSFQSSGSWKSKSSSSNSSSLLDLSNALIELPEDVVAIQITRIAWETFGNMTPRDLMRHVLAPRDPKNPRTALRDANSNVMQSINFVNYLADWVATLILVQPKLKWRARILEKFITIAYSLREQENFDSLMGVLAGLNSQPVYRLTETMEMINLKLEGDRTKIPKRLRSLNKLMATTKSFSAYRLALANSGANMLPYLGVHLQDITVVNEIKSDMRDGKVNWSKFSQMGRSAAIVLDCSRLAPSLPIDRGVERCILNVPLLDKDRQYALSYSYQPKRDAAKPVSSARARLRTLADKSPFFS